MYNLKSPLNNILLDMGGRKLKHFDKEYNLSGIAVVVSPHPDDESIAMGGTIAKLLSFGFIIYVIYATIEVVSPFKIITSNRRKHEAMRALKELGVAFHHIYYLDLPDGDVKRMSLNFSKSAGKLKVLISKILPKDVLGKTLILTTSHFDAHRDHEEVFNMVKNGLRKYFILEFPTVNHISSSFVSNCIIDISGQYHKKYNALIHYSGEIKKGRILWEDIDQLENETGKLISVDKAESCFISWYGYMSTD